MVLGGGGGGIDSMGLVEQDMTLIEFAVNCYGTLLCANEINIHSVKNHWFEDRVILALI